jgi:hypothetical protein
MKALIKILIFLFVIGLILAVSGFFMGLNMTSLSSFFNDDASYGELVTYTQDEAVDEVLFNFDKRHVAWVLTDETNMTLTYHIKDDDTWTFDVEDNVLIVSQKEKQGISNWFNYKYVSKPIITVTVNVPQTWVLDLDIRTGVGEINLGTDVQKAFGTVKLVSGTGTVRVSQASITLLDVSVGTGNIILNDLNLLEDLDLSTGTGNQQVNRVEVLGDATLKSGTGQITITALQSHDLNVTNSTGRTQVVDSVVQSKLSIINSTGDVIVRTTLASDIVLRSSTGNVKLTVTDVSLYQFDLRTSTGRIHVSGNDQGNRYTGGSGSVDVSITVSTGNVTIETQ